MALTFTAGPNDQFIFSRQPAQVKITTDARITTAKVKYTRTITFINYPTSDSVLFSLSWNGTSVVMMSMATPITADGTKYRKRQGAETLATWISHFAEDIAFNFYIARDFIISYTTTTLTITARFAGSDYNPTLSDIPGTVTTDYTLGAETLGVDEVVASNYKLLLDIVLSDTEFIRKEMYLLSESGTNSIYLSHIQNILHNAISSAFPSSTNITTIETLTDGQIIKKYWLRYFQIIGTTPVPGHFYLNNNSASYFYAVCGGHFLESNQSFLLSYSSTILFLTWQKRTKYVTQDQPEWLYWFIPNSNCYTGNLRLVITYTDASTTTVLYAWSVTELIAMCKAVGYRQIVEPNATVGKTVEKWVLTIMPADEVEPLTAGESFTYYPVTEPTPWTKYFIFRNSFNAYDTFRNIGVSEHTLNVTGEILSQFLASDYIPGDSPLVNSESSNTIKYKAAVGFETQPEMIDYLRELFVNPSAAIVTFDEDADDGTTLFHPIVILPSSIQIKRDNDMLYSIEFEYQDAFQDTGIYNIIT